MTVPSVAGKPARSEVIAANRGDYWIARAPWTSRDARDRIVARHLADDEVADLARLPAPARDGRVLGRIVAKQAVRRWLADRGAAPADGVTIRIRNEPGGRPRALVGVFEPVGVSVAHCGTTAVAAVALVHPGVDIEAIAPRGSVFARLALTTAELRMGDGHDPDEWVTRLWTVKEAAAKAAGTGLRGRPKDIEVHAVDGDLAWTGTHIVRSAREGGMVVSTVVAGV